MSLKYFHPYSTRDGIWSIGCNVAPYVPPAVYPECKIWSCSASFVWERFLSLLSLDFFKEKETQPVNVKSQLGTKAIVWIISSRLNSFLSTLSSVQLDLVKMSIMYVLWYHAFKQVLFDMPKLNMFFFVSIVHLH